MPSVQSVAAQQAVQKGAAAALVASGQWSAVASLGKELGVQFGASSAPASGSGKQFGAPAAASDQDHTSDQQKAYQMLWSPMDSVQKRFGDLEGLLMQKKNDEYYLVGRLHNSIMKH